MKALRPSRLVGACVIVLALVASACAGNSSGSSSGGSGDAATPACLTFEDLYALVGPESEGFGNWQDAQDLATELGSSTELPDVSLSITAPGEESGTYDTFIELALEDIGDARAEAGHISEDDAGTTRKDYSSQADDNVIIEGISSNDGSLGWVGYAFASENPDAIGMFGIDGGDGCIDPTAETIASFEYPLSRPLFIYVDVDKAANDPAVAAFVDFYMSDDGRTLAEEAGYVPLTPEAWAEVQELWRNLGIEVSTDVSGSISISGSSTVEPITGLAAELFQGEHGNVSISVRGPGTGDGFAEFCAGEIPITDASRGISDEEVELCGEGGVEYLELQVGIDGLAVITRG